MKDDTRTCDEWRALMADALAGELSEADGRQLEKHLNTCEECVAEMRSLRSIWIGLLELPDTEDRPGTKKVLQEEVQAERRGDGVESGRAASDHRTPDRGPRPPHMRLWLARAAVLVLVFAGGLVAGRSLYPAGETDAQFTGSEERRYLLLLHEDEFFAGPPVDQAVQEYKAWAQELAADGRLEAAEKLAEDTGQWLSGPAGDRLQTGDGGAAGDAGPKPEAVAGRATGFFIVSAPSDSAAARTAETMPHIRYGGTVQIRQIEEVGD